MGICISYDRVLEVEDGIAAAVSEQFEEGVVAPGCLRKGLFTVGVQDNLDHNPSSTTAANAFHGTGISLFQFPTSIDPGESRPPVTVSPSRNKRHYLPDSDAIVPAVALMASDVDVPMHACLVEDVPVLPLEEDEEDAPVPWLEEDVPVSPTPTTSMQPLLNEAKFKENRLVEHALALIEKEELTSEDALAWAAYHASTAISHPRPSNFVCIIASVLREGCYPCNDRAWHGCAAASNSVPQPRTNSCNHL